MAPKNSLTLFSLFKKFLYIGAISFGGGIIAYMRQLIVKEEGWLTEDEFMVILSIGQTMPGLNSVNVSILLGDKLFGSKGSVVACLGLCIPGTLLVLILGSFYVSSGVHPLINKALTGITAGATALLAYVTWDLGKRNFESPKSLFIVALTFFLMSVLKIQLYYVILLVVPIALYLYRPKKEEEGE